VNIRPARLTAVSVLVAAALGAAALAFAASPASAAAPCWKQILNEWTHSQQGHVSTDYPLHCYGEAISHVPNDLAQYTGIIDDITAARQQAARPTRRIQSHSRSNPEQRTSNDPDSGLYNQAIGKIGPTNADSVPLPLLILAGLSLILVAAGGAGLVSRRLRTRKVPG
jgi:hypothetical protein